MLVLLFSGELAPGLDDYAPVAWAIAWNVPDDALDLLFPASRPTQTIPPVAANQAGLRDR
jgi:hypothetical protein